MEIRKITEQKKRYLKLLLLGDEQESMIDRYLGRGTLYVLEEETDVKAVCVVTDEGDGILEIKISPWNRPASERDTAGV